LPPHELLLVANSQIPTHQRLWCVLEAHVTLGKNKVFRVQMTGKTHHLLTSNDTEFIKTEMELYLADVVPPMQKTDDLTDMWSSGKITGKDYWSQAQQLNNGMDDIYQRIYKAQKKVLSMKDKELINLDNATTSHLDNELMIWRFITGEE